ncbi:MAG TPA: hypothetical protein VNE38_06280 [Ktedonobacteraceae bacterium]|nr:hypothetical protein [Ktedonobacteraceae bacterium]
MSDSGTTMQKAVVLWISGLPFADISAVAEVETLAAQGFKVELIPSLITGLQSQYFQVLGGKAPATFGFFDTLMPAHQLARPANGTSGYRIEEDLSGRDSAPRFFTDLLRNAGWTVELVETSPREALEKMRALPDNSPQPACKIIKIRLDRQTLTTNDVVSIAETLRLARVWMGASGLLALLCDAQFAEVKRFVNINNFLAEMGIIERDEQSGSIDWSNSLAYFAGHGQLWINLLGRDPQGAVHPQDEYAEVRDSLIKAIPDKLRDSKTGEKVVERVYRKEEIYAGDYLFCAPDLVVQFMPGYAPSQNSAHLGFDEHIFTDPLAEATTMAGMHPQQIRGYLLATAPSLAVNPSIYEPVPLTSVAPTLLHALGIEYAGMDSAAVEALFSPAYLETHPILMNNKSQELSDEDEELVIGRLRDLGYI